MICTINTITIISIISIIIYLIFNNKNKMDIQYQEKIKLLDQIIKESKKNIVDKINIADNQKINNKDNENACSISQIQPIQPIQPIPQIPQIHPNFIPHFDHVIARDKAVVSDNLYPPLARTERPIFDLLANRVASGLINYPTRGSPDTFRLIAYLVNTDTGARKDRWKLFGRQKYPGSSIGEYYAIPIDDATSDLKITLKDDIMPNEKIRDIYALPNEVTIKSPLFNSERYKIIELDKPDLTSPYL